MAKQNSYIDYTRVTLFFLGNKCRGCWQSSNKSEDDYF